MLIWKAIMVVLVVMLFVLLVKIERSVKLPLDLRIIRWLSYVLVSLATWITIS